MPSTRSLGLLGACVLGACSGATGGGGSVQVTASGEVLALGGYAFPPAAVGAPAFVDGWEVKFDKLIAVVGAITLSEDPDRSPGDAAQTGAVVATVAGPWAVDLHAGGPLPGKGGSGEQAVAIDTITSENARGGAGFDPTKRYAFGFDSTRATGAEKLVNLDAADGDYADMVANGWSVLYVGTATFKGGTSCTSTDPSYDFTQLPATVKFRLGFSTPTTYANCQNPDNDPATPLGDEEHERGIEVRENATTIAQLTFHSDHPFWESFVHDSPAHFDQLAAQAKVQADGTYLVTLDDAVGVDYQAFEDRRGHALPWRACDPQYTPPSTSPQMGFDSLTIPFDPTGDPATSMRDYRDYMRYDQSTQGHLDADGLCFVQRDPSYPSPR